MKEGTQKLTKLLIILFIPFYALLPLSFVFAQTPNSTPTPTPALSSTTVRFLYDGDGVRVAKIEEGKTTLYIGDVEKVLETGQTIKYYGLGGKRVAFSQKTNGQGPTTNYLVSDHLGSLRYLSNLGDLDGSSTAKVSYYPYGSVRSQTGTLPSRLYTSQINDNETGLYFYNARYYNPQTANFLQADTQNKSLNRYLYTTGSPVGFIDPSGNEPENPDSSVSSPFQIVDQCGIYNSDCLAKDLYNWFDANPDYDPFADSLAGVTDAFIDRPDDAIAYMKWKIIAWQLNRWSSGEEGDFNAGELATMAIGAGAFGSVNFQVGSNSGASDWIRLFHGSPEKFFHEITTSGIRTAATEWNPTFAGDFEGAVGWVKSSPYYSLKDKRMIMGNGGYVYDVTVPKNWVRLCPNGAYCSTMKAPLNPSGSRLIDRTIPSQFINFIYRIDQKYRMVGYASRQNNFQWIYTR